MRSFTKTFVAAFTITYAATLAAAYYFERQVRKRRKEYEEKYPEFAQLEEDGRD